MAYQSEIEKLEQRFGEKPQQWFAALADAYRKAGELDMALDLLKAWIEKRPNYTSGHIVLGRCLLDKDSLDEAAKAFEGVLGLDPENIIAIKALAEIAQKRGDPAGAEHWLEQLLDVDPMNEEAHEALAALRGGGAEPEAAPAEAPAAGEIAPMQPGGAAGQFDPMAIAGQIKRESDEVEQVAEPAAEEAAAAEPAEAVPEAVLEEVTLEMEPEEPSEFDIDVAFGQPRLSDDVQEVADEVPEGAVEGLVSSEKDVTPAGADDDQETPAGGTHAALDGLVIDSFDDELAWDAGERTSHQISSEDIEEALHAHENSLDEPAHLLPGIEDAEIPQVGVEERETPPVEGFEEPPAEGEEGTEPVEGLEPTVAAAADVELPAEVEAPPEMLAEPEFVEETPAAPAAAEAPAAEAAAPPEEPAAEEELPLILPEPEPVAEPEPIVTETMAELYAQQGLFVEAQGIYEQLLAARPGDAQLQSKLAEMKEKATAPKAPAAPPRGAQFSAAHTGGVSVRAMFAEILGAEPAAPIAAPAAPEAPAATEAPAAPEAPAATEEPAAPAAPAAEESAAETPAVPGFDEFFGGKEAPPAEGAEPTTRRSDDEGTEDQFRDWLKSLNT